MREHGTHACYVWGPAPGCLPGRGCRCAACSLARSKYERDRRSKAEPSYVAAGPVREHIAFLASEGVGLKQIAKVSGVAHGALWKLVYGVNAGKNRKARPPSKRCRPSTAEAILAVTPADGADGSRVPAGPVWEDVARLLGRGWTKSAVARAIGQNGPGLQIGEQEVTRRQARAIHALLDQPAPEDVGKAWSAHHQANAPAGEPEPEPVRLPGDDVLLALVELLEERIDQNGWRKRAACLGKPTWLFFPARGDHETVQAAKAVCATCPVASECLAANETTRDGVFGGLSARERRERRSVAA